jgi:hypothetical protein
MLSKTLARKIKQFKLGFSNMCKTWGYDPDPDWHQHDAVPQHWFTVYVFQNLILILHFLKEFQVSSRGLNT